MFDKMLLYSLCFQFIRLQINHFFHYPPNFGAVNAEKNVFSLQSLDKIRLKVKFFLFSPLHLAVEDFLDEGGVVTQPSGEGKACFAVEELCGTFFILHLAEKGGIRFAEGPMLDDGCGGIAGGADSVVKPFVRNPIGKTTCISNQDDAGMQRIVVG